MKDTGVRRSTPKTRNDGTMTESQYWGWLRSSLRRMSQRWRPIYGALADAKRPVEYGDTLKWGGRIKFVYVCAVCADRFPRRLVEVDHIVPCGSLRAPEDVAPFISRLLCEREGLRVVCKTCHVSITRGQKDV